MYSGIQKICNKSESLECKCLKQNDLLAAIRRNTLSNDAITVFLHNVRSLSKQIDDIVSDNIIIIMAL